MKLQSVAISCKKRRGMLLGLIVLLSAGGGFIVWQRQRGEKVAPLDPPLPAEMEDDEVRQVIESARRRVLENPRSASVWGQLGMTLLAQLFDREADVCLAEAARLDPGEALWPYGRGQIALKRDPDRALPLLRQAVTLVGDSASAPASAYRLTLAEALLERGERAEAEKLFRAESERKPDNPRAALGLGLLAVRGGEASSAEKYLLEARTSPYARQSSTAQLAALARRGGKLDEATRYEQEVESMAKDPPWPDPFLDRVMQRRVGRSRYERQADELEHQHRYAEAAELWLTQLRQERTCTACLSAAINLARLGDYERALPLVQEALQREPENAQAHYTMALILFTRAEKKWQTTPGAEDAKKWFRQSIPHAQQATQRKPDFASAYLFWGLAHKYLGELHAALPPLQRGLACRPDSAELNLALGEVLLQRKQKREAKVYLENARSLDAEDPRIHHALEHLNGEKE